MTEPVRTCADHGPFAAGTERMELLVGLPAALVAGAVVYLGVGYALPNAKLQR